MDKGIKPYMLIPRSTNYAIVFPYYSAGSQFEKKHYKPFMTNFRMLDEDLQNFLRELETQIETYTQQCGRDNLLRYFGIVFIFVIAVAIVAGLHAGGIIPDRYYDIMFPIVLSLLAVNFLIFCGLFVRFYFKSKLQATVLTQQAKIYVQEKGKAFQAKGLTWVIPQYYPTWIELWIDRLPPTEQESNKQYQIKIQYPPRITPIKEKSQQPTQDQSPIGKDDRTLDGITITDRGDQSACGKLEKSHLESSWSFAHLTT